MDEFEAFLKANDFPAPSLAARVSVYAQFGCGILLIAGAFMRWAALAMVVNFAVAIVGVHWSLPFRTWLEPCAMLACALALFIGGPGRVSVDELLLRRRP
jgi:putative oxidoreductase